MLTKESKHVFCFHYILQEPLIKLKGGKSCFWSLLQQVPKEFLVSDQVRYVCLTIRVAHSADQRDPAPTVHAQKIPCSRRDIPHPGTKPAEPDFNEDVSVEKETGGGHAVDKGKDN